MSKKNKISFRLKMNFFSNNYLISYRDRKITANLVQKKS